MKRTPTLPSDFNFDGYRYYNPDIAHFSDAQLKVHFLHSGNFERRLYSAPSIPLDFDPEVYRKLNPDLTNFTNTHLYHHYLRDGIVESRQYTNKLPPFIKKIQPLPKSDFLKWENIEYGNIFTVSPLNTNVHIENFSKDNLIFLINKKKYQVHRTFLINCNTDESDKFLVYYNQDFILLASQTQYFITGCYDVNKKILHINKDDKNLTAKVLNTLKQFFSLTEKYNKEFKELLQSKVKVFATFICVKQIMHNYINEISGLRSLFRQQLDTGKNILDRAYTFCEYFVKYEDFYKDVNCNSVKFIRNKTCEQMFLETCQDRLFLVKRCDLQVDPTQNQRVIDLCYETNLYNIDNKRYRNRILLTIRKSFRNLQNQIDFTVSIIEFLHKKYPMTIFYIDGITELLQSPYHINANYVQEEMSIFKQIQQRVSSNVALYSLLFLKFNTYVCLLQDVDFYISSVGTCQHKIGYFCSSKGFIHGGGDTLFSRVDADGFFWQKHFGKTCKPLPSNLFLYDNLNDYNSSYNAHIEKVIKYLDTSEYLDNCLI